MELNFLLNFLKELLLEEPQTNPAILSTDVDGRFIIRDTSDPKNLFSISLNSDSQEKEIVQIKKISTTMKETNINLNNEAKLDEILKIIFAILEKNNNLITKLKEKNIFFCCDIHKSKKNGKSKYENQDVGGCFEHSELVNKDATISHIIQKSLESYRRVAEKFEEKSDSRTAWKSSGSTFLGAFVGKNEITTYTLGDSSPYLVGHTIKDDGSKMPVIIELGRHMNLSQEDLMKKTVQKLKEGFEIKTDSSGLPRISMGNSVRGLAMIACIGDDIFNDFLLRIPEKGEFVTEKLKKIVGESFEPRYIVAASDGIDPFAEKLRNSPDIAYYYIGQKNQAGEEVFYTNDMKNNDKFNQEDILNPEKFIEMARKYSKRGDDLTIICAPANIPVAIFVLDGHGFFGSNVSLGSFKKIPLEPLIKSVEKLDFTPHKLDELKSKRVEKIDKKTAIKDLCEKLLKISYYAFDILEKNKKFKLKTGEEIEFSENSTKISLNGVELNDEEAYSKLNKIYEEFIKDVVQNYFQFFQTLFLDDRKTVDIEEVEQEDADDLKLDESENVVGAFFTRERLAVYKTDAERKVIGIESDEELSSISILSNILSVKINDETFEFNFKNNRIYSFGEDREPSTLDIKFLLNALNCKLCLIFADADNFSVKIRDIDDPDFEGAPDHFVAEENGDIIKIHELNKKLLEKLNISASPMGPSAQAQELKGEFSEIY